MSTTPRVPKLAWTETRRDLALVMGAHAFYKLAGYGIILLLARHLPQEAMGAFFFSLSLAYVFVAVVDLGTDGYLVRALAAGRDDAGSALADVYSLRAPAACAYLVVVNAFAGLTKPELLPVVATLSVITLLEDLYSSAGAALVGLRRVGLSVAVGVGGKILLVVSIVAAVLAGWDLLAVLAAYAIGHLVVAAGTWIVLLRVAGRFGLHADRARIGAVLRSSLPFFVLVVVGNAHFKVDALLLGYISTMSAVAVYEVAFKFLEASRFIMRPVVTVFYPVLCRHAALGEWSDVSRITRKLLAGAAGAGVVIAALAFAGGERLLSITFGDTYAASTGVLRVLFLSLPCVFLTTAIGIVLKAREREGAIVPALIVAVVVNVALDLVAIPRFGLIGAAWATVISHSGLALWLLARVPRVPAAGTLVRDLEPRDVGAVHALNQGTIPSVSSLTMTELEALAAESAYFRVAVEEGRVVAFLGAFTPEARYASENFRWFRARYDAFVYVDRIVVAPEARSGGIGARLYADVEAFARARGIPRITCEVNTRPMNEGSLRFHAREGFVRVGTQETDGGAKEVALLAKTLDT